jgi:hypothetical protein
VGEEHRTYHWGVGQPANQRLTVAQAAASLGITEGAVRSRIKRGTLPTTKEGGTVYVLLGGSTSKANQTPTTGAPTGQPELLEALRDQIRDLRDQLEQANERDRENRRIIAALTSRLPAIEAPASTEPPERPETATVEAQQAEPRPSTGGAKRETTRPPATSAPTSRLGMSAWALAVSAIATPLTWVFVVMNQGVSDYLLVLLFLFPLLPGLWAGTTKRPSLPWFSSPHRWLRRGGRSVLEIAVFAAGMPSGVGLAAANLPLTLDPQNAFSPGDLAFSSLLVFATASLAFMSGAFLGNALRRVGLLGTPKEPPQGEEEGDQEEVWSAKKEAQWGLAGSIIVALISAVASIVTAVMSGT